MIPLEVFQFSKDNTQIFFVEAFYDNVSKNVPVSTFITERRFSLITRDSVFVFKFV